ncbi:KPN_02809 family neutral zinc metallopeptidase [Humidisolicoccus flavus]|uniref:KPN_02809 family neutral zinc metallopeptidase n=1 Tax=Humidisolicoccus flavus TaxID=3111414 RepID=UPI0032492CA8
MTFNEGSEINTTTVRRRRRTTGAAIGGGGALIAVALFVVSQLTGFDLTGLVNTAPQNESSQSDEVVAGCTGADANAPANVDCRMSGGADSLDAYWNRVFENSGGQYLAPTVTLFDEDVATACGVASSAVGPFYCPADQVIYIDTAFFAQLQNQFGAQGGSLAEMYVLAHEWGHHIQFLTGTLDNVDHSDTGPQSSAVRSELQADCYAGAWIAGASTTPDDGGTPLLKPVTEEELAQALDAARVIGDDAIQESTGQNANPDGWTHGSSEQRQTWLMNGFEGGAGACDTWSGTV